MYVTFVVLVISATSTDGFLALVHLHELGLRCKVSWVAAVASNCSEMFVWCIVVCRKSSAYRNVQFSPTDAMSASQFQSKVIFDEIEKRLKEV